MKEQEQISWKDFNPVCIGRRLLHELPVILAAGLAAAMLTVAIMQFMYRAEYTSSATVAVSVKSGSYTAVISDLSVTTEIANTFKELFASNMFSNVAKTQMGVSNLPGTLKASVLPETNIMQLSVTASSPDDAFCTLRLLLDNYDEVSEYIFQNIVLKSLSSPNLPTSPSNPIDMKATGFKAFVLGCAGMAAVVLVIMFLSNTIQTSNALRSKLNVKLITSIHHEEKNKTRKSKRKKLNKGVLLTMPTASFRFIEEFHRLSSVVESASQKGKRKVILVTSTAENEGKSTVAANLALALSQSGKKVLVIDADMHKEAQYKLFTENSDTELADVIRGEAEYDPIKLEEQDLSVYLSKKKDDNAAELVASEGMKNLLDKARKNMDFIIIDTPPMELFSDVEVLADLSDISILVVRQDSVPAGRLEESVEILKQCKADFIGCVFNDVRSTTLSSDSYGYGYGHYGYGYGHYGYGHYGYGYDGYDKQKKAE